MNKNFGPDKVRVYPGHQVIEMGLVKLYRTTGESKYLDLAKFFLDIRGPKGEQYNQAHKKVVDQTEAVGHSVRATYMYSGMADIAAIKKDSAYLKAITKIWEDIVYKKIYITGGIGATGGNEGFAGPFVLPNMTAYCETCASIGNIFTNHRLFLLYGESKYIDILEKTLYNSMLSGVSLSADRFFYPNPLESEGQHQRSAWFGCACCPSNIARFVPAIPGYIYAVREKDVYCNLYISNDSEFRIKGNNIRLSQKANFPWNGKVSIEINPEQDLKFSLMLRIPGWTVNEAIPGSLYRFSDISDEAYRILINGERIERAPENGYIRITRKWESGDSVEIEFPMPVRKVIADERVEDDRGKIALQRGPLIYCAEWPDNNTGNILNLLINDNAAFSTEFRPSLLEGTQIVKATGYQTRRMTNEKLEILPAETITLIPYALWNNRGPGQMRVWLPVAEGNSIPQSTGSD